MTRRIRLACEACDYLAEMAERIPFARDASGAASALPPESRAKPDSFFSDWLCGECRRPTRVELVDGAPETKRQCSTCGSALLSFDVAAKELAEASRSRVGRDLALEREGMGRIHTAIDSVAELEESRRNGDSMPQEALDTLAGSVRPRAGEPQAEELANTVALGGLAEMIENAANLGAARTMLKKRDEMGAKHIAVLEQWCADEQKLPGVPCPQCGTGQLLHWPVWD